jgi:hypothetical protein
MSLVKDADDHTQSNAAADSPPNIRPLTQDDEDEFCRLLLRLEPSARCCRFGHAPKDANLVNYAKSSLANADCILGAYVAGRLPASIIPAINAVRIDGISGRHIHIWILIGSGFIAAAQIGKAIISIPLILTEMAFGFDFAGLIVTIFRP